MFVNVEKFLKQGNKDSLEGRVIIYSIYNPSLRNPDVLEQEKHSSIIGIFGTMDPEELKHRIDCPDHIVAKCVQERDEGLIEDEFPEEQLRQEGVPNQFIERLRECGLKPISFPFYAVGFIYDSLEKLKICPGEDVFFMGEYSEIEECQKVVTRTIDAYIQMFMPQFIGGKDGGSVDADTFKSLKERIWKKTHHAQIQEERKSAEKLKMLMPVKTYIDIPDSQIKQHITESYVSPMIYAIQSNNRPEIELLGKKLNYFSKGSNFEWASSDLSDLMLLEGFSEENFALVTAYVAVIAAIHSEDWSAATKYKKQIDSLKDNLKSQYLIDQFQKLNKLGMTSS